MLYPILPSIYSKFDCPTCKGSNTLSRDVLFQGIHILVEFECCDCKNLFFGDLPLSQSLATPYTVDKSLKNIYGESRAMSWYGKPLLDSLRKPLADEVIFSVEKLIPSRNVIIINCIDYLYGHSLLKLLNTDFFLRGQNEKRIIVLIPKSLRWLVPDGVAEVWIVEIPFSNSNNFYLELNQKIKEELKRFLTVDLAGTIPHPNDFSIQNYSRVPPHSFPFSPFRITFIWREDRLWTKNHLFSHITKTIPQLRYPFRMIQNIRVQRLFSKLRSLLPGAKFTIAGLGTSTYFPNWIEDIRYNNPTFENERNLCSIYSESRLIIGIHGSNLLLPSAHAGITIDLMPCDRWGNIAQDIIFKSIDVRKAVYRYRFLPETISIKDLFSISLSSINDFKDYENLMDYSHL